MELDRNSLEVLSREECIQLLSSTSVARVGVTVDALPVIVPVNFIVAGDHVLLRSAAGTKLTAALANSVIALEADSVDGVSHAGWSVLVQGMSRVLDDPHEIAEALAEPLLPWANQDADRFIVIDLQRVSGRRLCPWERLAYLPEHVHHTPRPSPTTAGPSDP